MSDFERFIDWADFLGIDGPDAFDTADELLDHFGRESCSVGDASMDYLNTGDTYSETLVLDSDGSLICTTWGDWHDAAEIEYREENDVVRCGYCGNFTDDYADDWHDNVCNTCGNLVGG